jgi:alkanesulfonate monooxygenase SsuD/methylene tetrahydromethanopterin reductase-like flavin-dependent oxidoreductase (luciferase family)
MKAGIIFANSGAFSRPELFGQLAREAEECGFDSIWTVEHVVIPQPHMPYPGSKDGQMPGGDNVPIPDPLIPLAYAAAITRSGIRCTSRNSLRRSMCYRTAACCSVSGAAG